MNDLSFFRTWLPFIYLYGAGGVIFLGGMVYIVYSKALDLKRPKDKYWFKILIFGFLFYFSLHGVLILAALYL